MPWKILGSPGHLRAHEGSRRHARPGLSSCSRVRAPRWRPVWWRTAPAARRYPSSSGWWAGRRGPICQTGSRSELGSTLCWCTAKPYQTKQFDLWRREGWGKRMKQKKQQQKNNSTKDQKVTFIQNIAVPPRPSARSWKNTVSKCQQRWAGVSGTVIEHSSHVVWGSASTMQRNLWQIILRISSWIPSARRSHQKKSKKLYSSPPLHPATCAIESFAPRCFMVSPLATTDIIVP